MSRLTDTIGAHWEAPAGQSCRKARGSQTHLKGTWVADVAEVEGGRSVGEAGDSEGKAVGWEMLDAVDEAGASEVEAEQVESWGTAKEAG